MNLYEREGISATSSERGTMLQRSPYHLMIIIFLLSHDDKAVIKSNVLIAQWGGFKETLKLPLYSAQYSSHNNHQLN